MLYGDFSDCKALPPGQGRNKAVNLTIQVKRFGDLAAIGFQTAVEIVNFNTGNSGGKEVKNF